MSFISYMLLGLIAGFIASRIVNSTGSGIITDIILGVVGALVGGYVFEFFGFHGVTGFNLWSLCVAVVGAIIILAFYHTLIHRRNKT